ncbi:MAG: SAF domain-containing protein [Actinobacteria bacterium]|nr:SAF domain-containing protein [Actinomycetota bacterium]
MNRASLIFKQKFISIIFIIIALIGGVLIYFYISNLKASLAKDPMSNEVLIAKEDIEKGSEIQIEMITKQKISKNIFSNNFISNESEIVGKEVKDKILKGEIISRDKINGFDNSSSKNLKFSTYIPLNKSAVTIPVIFWGDKSMINEGDKVNIISTYYENENGNLKSEIVLNEKEIVIISKQQSGENEVKNKSTGLSLLSNDDLEIKDNKNNIYLTFYLNNEEITAIFEAIEKGNLYVALCSSKLF